MKERRLCDYDGVSFLHAANGLLLPGCWSSRGQSQEMLATCTLYHHTDELGATILFLQAFIAADDIHADHHSTIA
jgi:hypothetical protein